MPSFCSAYGCSNNSSRDDVVFHHFPTKRRLAAKRMDDQEQAANTDQHQGNGVFFVLEEHLRRTVCHTCLVPCKQVDIRAKSLLADMPQLSASFQTYGVNDFHSLLIHFASKFRQHSYE
ncbi:hypothetical protein MRX96_045385 [Rhipicephalus microplus]